MSEDPGTKVGAPACAVPAIKAADGHLRAVGRTGRKRKVKKQKNKRVTVGFVRDTKIVVIQRTVNWLALVTGIKSLFLLLGTAKYIISLFCKYVCTRIRVDF